MSCHAILSIALSRQQPLLCDKLQIVAHEKFLIQVGVVALSMNDAIKKEIKILC